MIEFGYTLKAAREARGLSIAQLAEATRMAPSTIEELEHENFSRIAAPIYGRGFVKLYCEAVGIEAKPLVNEFMEIYNGNRDVSIREREVAAPAPEPEPTAPAVPEPVAASLPEEPVDLAPSFYDQPRQEDLELQAETTSAPVSAFEPEPTDAQPTFSRYAAPLRDDVGSPPPMPRTFLRMLTVGLILLVLLSFIVYGITVLYRATSAAAPAPATPVTEVRPNRPEPVPATTKTSPAKRSADAPARTPQQIPPLYID